MSIRQIYINNNNAGTKEWLISDIRRLTDLLDDFNLNFNIGFTLLRIASVCTTPNNQQNNI